MFDPAQITSHATYEHPETFQALAADHAAGRLYLGSTDGALYVIDLAAEKKEPVARWTKHDNYVSSAVFVDRGSAKWVISGSYDRQLVRWDASTGEPLNVIAAHEGWVRDLTLVPGTNLLASVGDDMLVKLWDIDSLAPVRILEGHALRTPQGHVTALYTIAASPDGKFLASGDRIGEVRVWEAATGGLVQTFQVPTLYTYDPVQRKRSIGGIRSLAFSPDGGMLAAGGIGQINNVDGLSGPLHVELWDWRSPRMLAALGAEAHQAMINDLSFHPTEPWLLGAGGGSDNGALVAWKIDALPPPLEPSADGKPPPPQNGQRIKAEGHIHRILLNSACTHLYAAGYRKLEVWRLG